MDGENFRVLLHVAKGKLCYARFYKQLAEEAKDFRDLPDYHCDPGARDVLDEIRKSYVKSAKEDRLAVKKLLKELEIQNGRWFHQDLLTQPLETFLDGKRFKDWAEYDAVLNDLADKLPCDRWSK